jgi:hypothetical protein
LQRRPHRLGIELQGISYVFYCCNLLSRDLTIRLRHQQAGIENDARHIRPLRNLSDQTQGSLPTRRRIGEEKAGLHREFLLDLRG